MNAKNDLFELEKAGKEEKISKNSPLALKMRPRNLEEFVGQDHVLGPGKLLRRLIDLDRISSLILYGPPGTGKSALGYIISKLTNSEFDSVHAAAAGIKEVKEKLLAAKKLKKTRNIRTILFVDEIHRFNKAQQDIFLEDVELGNIILIGATTHNPFFYVVPALISRSHVFEFKPHSLEQILLILKAALADKERGIGDLRVELEKGALEHICLISNGDARRALNALEVGILTIDQDKDKNKKIYFTKEVAEESIQKRIIRYDRDEDDHYDVISAFIKSMRGTDPDAALYWLAKMIYAGEDPRFIARRILICASEDVGNADPQALVLANAVFEAVEVLGMPEARIPLAQAVVYVACAPKSNASYLGIEKAAHDIANEASQEVPDHLKDASYKSAKKLDHGAGYQYAHDFENHYVKQEYMRKKKNYYQPTVMGYEKKIKAWLEYLKKTEKE
ncbi:MAG: replication-associated recombination protein A [Candidatus Omnitrophica bacterium]|nr:replication-associated recombination protein A [Candidatus Omnitrophota bacterium]